MHPIEWLRAIARRDDLAHAELAAEAAAALAALAGDPFGLVPACRRLIDRHPEVGALWWACARLLSAGDPQAEARAIENDLAADQVGLSLALDLPADVGVSLLEWSPLAFELADRRPDLAIDIADRDALDDGRLGEPAGEAGVTAMLLVEAWAVGDRAVLGPEWLEDAVGMAAGAGMETWLLVGVGRRLPEPLFRAVERRRRADDPRTMASGVLDLARVSRTVEPLRIPCPCPPELL